MILRFYSRHLYEMLWSLLQIWNKTHSMQQVSPWGEVFQVPHFKCIQFVKLNFYAQVLDMEPFWNNQD